MPKRTGSQEHLGHEIRLTNYWSLLPPRSWEMLELDGKIVAERHGSVFSDIQAELSAEVVLDGQAVVLVGQVGQKGPRTGGRILVDGAYVGSDRKMDFQRGDILDTILRGGFPGFFLRRGLPGFGLPFGVSMSMISRSERPGTLSELIAEVLLYGGPFALIMSLPVYLWLRRRARRR